jgi:hypothetical protein
MESQFDFGEEEEARAAASSSAEGQQQMQGEGCELDSDSAFDAGDVIFFWFSFGLLCFFCRSMAIRLWHGADRRSYERTE